MVLCLFRGVKLTFVKGFQYLSIWLATLPLSYQLEEATSQTLEGLLPQLEPEKLLHVGFSIDLINMIGVTTNLLRKVW